MLRYSSSLGSIELTEERLQHVVTFHPEVQKFIKHFNAALTQPTTIRRSSTDPKVLIYYKLLHKQKYLAIVVKTNTRNFILTAYITTKIQHKLP